MFKNPWISDGGTGGSLDLLELEDDMESNDEPDASSSQLNSSSKSYRICGLFLLPVQTQSLPTSSSLIAFLLQHNKLCCTKLTKDRVLSHTVTLV